MLDLSQMNKEEARDGMRFERLSAVNPMLRHCYCFLKSMLWGDCRGLFPHALVNQSAGQYGWGEIHGNSISGIPIGSRVLLKTKARAIKVTVGGKGKR